MINIIKYFFSSTKDIKPLVIFYCCISVIVSIISALFPMFEGYLIDSITQKNIRVFVVVICIYGSLSLVSLLLNLFINKYAIKISNNSLNQMLMNNIDGILHISYDEICKKDPSVISQELIYDCTMINEFILNSTLSMGLNICMFIFTLNIIARYSIVMIFFIILSSIIYILIYFCVKNKIYEFSKQLNESNALYFSYFYKMINSIKDIRLNSFIDNSKKIQNDVYNNQLSNSLQYQNVINIQELLSGFLSFFVQLFIFIYGFNLVLQNHISVGTIVVISKYSSTILGYSKGILNYVSEYQNTKASYNRVVLWKKIPKIEKGTIVLNRIDKIECKDLKFCYNNGFTLYKKNLQFETGNIYLIKGNNGSGKTTLVDCIFGLFGNNYEGKILFNNINIQELDMDATLKLNFSIAQQIPYLMETSIKENMCCTTNTTNEIMEHFIKGFGLNQYINRLPDKENTIFNLFSDDISGGEKQKISLIRTFLSRKPVIIFDEPFTYLDENSKKFFVSEINKLKKTTIIIIVTHENIDIDSSTIFI